MRRLARTAGLTGLALWIVATAAVAGSPIKVVDSPGYEFGSAAGGGFVAWAKGATLNGDYDLFVKEIGVGTDVFDAGRFPQVGTIEIGGDHGDVLVYSVEPSNGDTNIRFLNLATSTISSPPAGVNTSGDEDYPAISGEHLLFGRGPAGRAFSKRVILYHFTNQTFTVLATAPTGGTVTTNAIRGDFVTYTVCPSTGKCNVFRYRISTGGKVKMPNPNRANYWSSVLEDGTVYYVQGSPTYCGVNTKIKRFQAGSVSTLYAAPQGIEIADLDALVGAAVVHFTRINCLNNFRSGIWRIAG